jgi:hypothetical protein
VLERLVPVPIGRTDLGRFLLPALGHGASLAGGGAARHGALGSPGRSSISD